MCIRDSSRPRSPANQARWPGNKIEAPSEANIRYNPEVETIYTGGSTTTAARPGAPSIVSPLTAGALLNAPFEYHIVATNNPISYNATGLPRGLRVNTATGVISGTPTQEGVYRVILSATKGHGTSRATLVLTVSASLAIPDIISPLTAMAAQGQAFSYTIVATNGPTLFGADNLPAGLAIDTRTGRITGTPRDAGVFNITLIAINAAGAGRAILALTVSPPAPIITSALTLTSLVEKNFQYQITAANNPTAFDARDLPPGLAVNRTTGLITGMVPENAAGIYRIVLSASNDAGTGTALLNINFTYAIFKVNGQPPEDADVIFGAPFTVEMEFYRAGYAPAVVWRSYALGVTDADRAEWRLEGDTQASAGSLTIKHAADGSTNNATFGWDTILAVHYKSPYESDTVTSAYLALTPAKAVTMKYAWHPDLAANRRDIASAFNLDDAPLARHDNDGPRHLQDISSEAGRQAMLGAYDKDDVPLKIDFVLSDNGAFPDQSNASFPETERYDYTNSVYNNIHDFNTAVQLHSATFAHIKQVNSLTIGEDDFAGHAVPALSSIILSQSIRVGTCIHEWMHLAGVEHRSETTSATVPFDPNDRAAPYLMSYGIARNEINRYERLKMLAWPAYEPGQPGAGGERAEPAVNHAPFAIAACLVEKPQAGKPVMLSASASFDPDAGDFIASWRWQQVSGPPVELTDADTPFPSFIPAHPGVYVFALTVVDSRGRASEASAPSSVQVAVLP